MGHVFGMNTITILSLVNFALWILHSFFPKQVPSVAVVGSTPPTPSASDGAAGAAGDAGQL